MSDETAFLARTVEDLVRVYFTPDLAYVRSELAGYGFGPERIDAVLAAHYDEGALLRQGLLTAT